MSGGRIIEIVPMTLVETGKKVVRLWCVDRNTDETCVYVEEFNRETGPKIGDEIWWQAMKVYYDGDRQHLAKIGFSFSPQPTTQRDPAGR